MRLGLKSALHLRHFTSLGTFTETLASYIVFAHMLYAWVWSMVPAQHNSLIFTSEGNYDLSTSQLPMMMMIKAM